LKVLRTLAQSIVKKLAQQQSPQPRGSIESQSYCFHYLIDSGVCYIAMTEKAYPKKLAFHVRCECIAERTKKRMNKEEGHFML